MAIQDRYFVGDQVADAVARAYSEAEAIMLRKVAERLARGIDAPGWAEDKLAQIQALNKDLLEVTDDLNYIGDAVANGIIESADFGQTEALREAKSLGLAKSILPPPVVNPALKALITEAVDATRSTHRRILRTSQDVYRRAVAAGSEQVLTGVNTTREAVQKVLDEFANQGVTGFVDSAGKNWSLQTYTEMAVRSACHSAEDNAHLDSIEDIGHDLVIVSAHGDCCDLCAPWEGRVLSVSGNDDRYPSVEDAKGEGLKHPNCRHTFGIYIEGRTKAKEVPHDPEAYEAREKQRYNERQIRLWKRRDAVALTPEKQAISKGKIAEWQKTQREHIADTNTWYREKHGTDRFGNDRQILWRKSDREQVRVMNDKERKEAQEWANG